MTNEAKKEKLLEALETIRKVCEENNCKTCPFRGVYNECGVQEMVEDC